MKFLLPFLFFLFLGEASGQETALPAMGNVFWKIESSKNNKVSYLFGTIHLIDKEKYNLPKTVTKRLVKSDIVIMEIADLDDQTGMMDLIRLEEGRMTDILSFDQKDSLYRYTKQKFGLDSAKFEDSFGRFKPVFFLQLPYTNQLIMSESYDKNINNIAKKEGIPIEGLETAQEQIGYFDNLPNRTKAKMIMQVVGDTSDLKKTWNALQELYLNQQISDMMTYNAESADVSNFMETTLSSERNKRWIPKLKTHLNEKTVFIAVGAGHLPGEDGLVNLLKLEGFSVTPIQIKLN